MAVSSKLLGVERGEKSSWKLSFPFSTRVNLVFQCYRYTIENSSFRFRNFDPSSYISAHYTRSFSSKTKFWSYHRVFLVVENLENTQLQRKTTETQNIENGMIHLNFQIFLHNKIILQIWRLNNFLWRKVCFECGRCFRRLYRLQALFPELIERVSWTIIYEIGLKFQNVKLEFSIVYR